MKTSMPSQLVSPWMPGLMCGLALIAGCRQAAHREESPTPLLPSPAESSEWIPDAVPYSAPSMPPAQDPTPVEELLVPPPPGTALRPLEAEVEFGGFTPARSLAPHDISGPALPPPPKATQPAAEIQSVAGEEASDDEELSLPTLEFEPVLAVESSGSDDAPVASPLLTEEAAPVRPWIRPRSTSPVALDPSLFVSELMAEGNSTNPAAPRPASAPLPITLPLLIPDAESDADVEPGRLTNVPTWPQSGLPHGMVISPGPVTEKWSPQLVNGPMDRGTSVPPQRLATQNSDWDSRRID